MFNPKVPCNSVSALLFIFLEIIILIENPEISKQELKKKNCSPISPVPVFPGRHIHIKKVRKQHIILWILLVEICLCSLHYFPFPICSPYVWQVRIQGSGHLGPRYILMTAFSWGIPLTKCLPGPSGQTELWVTAFLGEASPGAFINTTRLKDQTKMTPFSSRKMLSLLH